MPSRTGPGAFIAGRGPSTGGGGREPCPGKISPGAQCGAAAGWLAGSGSPLVQQGYSPLSSDSLYLFAGCAEDRVCVWVCGGSRAGLFVAVGCGYVCVLV